eukprot:6741537-Prymnesium_polylepis.2
MRITSELTTSSKYYRRELVEGAAWPAAWLTSDRRVTPELFLRRMLAKQLECSIEEVPMEAVEAADTLPNRLRWMYKETMGADGEFERQWGEVALLRKVKKETISEDLVARAIIRSVCPGGWMRELLELGQLGFIHRDTLFVHGGLVGGPWQGSGDGITCYGYVPGRADRIMDAREWIAALNEWKRTQLAEWMQQPFWVDPSDVTTNVPTRAASALIDYVCPGCEPSVVMGRQLDKKGMPRPLSADLVATLNGSGIYKLAVGHTPHGNAPTLLQTSGLLMVMADTSYSDMSSPDNRGAAISEVQFLEDGSVRVSGVLQDGRKILFSLPDSTSPWVGHTLPVFPPSSSGQEPSNKSTDDLGFSPKMIETAALDALDGKEYFVKAYLREEELYLLCNVDGFVQSYVTLAALELNALFKKACGGQGRTSGGRNPATDVR